MQTIVGLFGTMSQQDRLSHPCNRNMFWEDQPCPIMDRWKGDVTLWWVKAWCQSFVDVPFSWVKTWSPSFGGRKCDVGSFMGKNVMWLFGWQKCDVTLWWAKVWSPSFVGKNMMSCFGGWKHDITLWWTKMWCDSFMDDFGGWKRDASLSWVEAWHHAVVGVSVMPLFRGWKWQQIALSNCCDLDSWQSCLLHADAETIVCWNISAVYHMVSTQFILFIKIWSSWWHLQCHTSAMNVDLATGNSIGENWREFLTLFGILTSPWFNQSESFLTIDVNFLFKYIGWRGHFRSNFCSDRLPLQEEVATNFHRLDPKTSITTGASTPYCNEVSPRKTKEETRNNTSNNIGES